MRAVVLTLALIAGGLAAGAPPRGDGQAIIIKLEELDLSGEAPLLRRDGRSDLVMSLKGHAQNSQAELLRFLTQKGAKHIRPLWVNNAIACTVSSSLLNEILKRGDVKEVVPDEVITLDEPLTSATGTPGWNLSLIEAPELWLLGHTGQSVVVGSLDTGVDIQHLALASQFRGGTNSWFDPSLEHPSVPYDSAGHGTQAMSLIVGGTINQSAIGLAPAAKWISAKIFDDEGNAPASNIHAGFQWLLDPDNNTLTNDAPDVVSLSWGYSTLPNNCYREFTSDISKLKAADIVVVAAAGNLGPAANTSMSPANYQNVLSVGSVGKDSVVSSFSSRGGSPCGAGVFPKLVAPGEFVLVADRTSGGANPSATIFGSGTSFSSPQVAGAAALLRGAFPLATAAQIEAALLGTAKDLGAVGADNNYGQGLVKLQAAYNALRTGNIPSDPETPPSVIGSTQNPVPAGSGCTQNNQGATPIWPYLVLLAILVFARRVGIKD